MIKEIKLINIRNIDRLHLKFDNNFIYIKGPNGIGKTTILESINFISTSRSHRTKNDQDLINVNQEFGIIELETTNNSFQVVISNKGKLVKINKKEIRKLSNFVGKIKTVLFSPEDLNIIKGSPYIRREFIDLELIKLDRNYLEGLSKYRKLLKQRNALLKTMDLNSDYTILNLISDELYLSGSELIDIKIMFIEKLNQYFKNIFNKFSEREVLLKYLPSIDKNDFLKHLKENQKQDILYKTTAVGPHRDDLSFYFNKNEAKNASQGEIRLMVISLKLALVSLIKNEIGEDVVLLLDDVLSELDKNIQTKFLKELPKNMQIIMNSAINITSNNIKIIDLEGVKNGK